MVVRGGGEGIGRRVWEPEKGTAPAFYNTARGPGTELTRNLESHPSAAEVGWGKGSCRLAGPLPVHVAVQLGWLLANVFVIVLQKAEPIGLN